MKTVLYFIGLKIAEVGAAALVLALSFLVGWGTLLVVLGDAEMQRHQPPMWACAFIGACTYVAVILMVALMGEWVDSNLALAKRLAGKGNDAKETS